MAGIARLSDPVVGTCTLHVVPIAVGGLIVIGSPNVGGEKLGVATLGGTVVCTCGHASTIVAGTPKVLTNQKPTSRLGDPFANGPTNGVIVGGARTVLTS